MKYISNNSSAFCFRNMQKMYLQSFPNFKKIAFHAWLHTSSHKKHVCTILYSWELCDFCLSRLFISSLLLIKAKIKKQQGNIQKPNHVLLKENPLQNDSLGIESCCYVLHTEKTTLKTITQQTSYINNLQLWQAHLRSYYSLR